jgi:hypothetical protein
VRRLLAWLLCFALLWLVYREIRSERSTAVGVRAVVDNEIAERRVGLGVRVSGDDPSVIPIKGRRSENRSPACQHVDGTVWWSRPRGPRREEWVESVCDQGTGMIDGWGD